MKKIFNLSIIIILLLSTLTGVCIYFWTKIFNNASKQFFYNSEPQNFSTSQIPSTSTASQPSVRVPILVYHSVRPYYFGESNFQKIYDVEPNNFIQQLEYLKTHGYTVVGFDDLINYLNGQKSPAKPVIISFDDGWDNQYTYALPILQKEKMAATFFIYPNAIGHKKFMTWSQVQELTSAGMTIGGHSKSHPYLWKITDPAKLKEEITDSKKIIEDHIGKKITTFAYPFGLYRPITIEAVKSAGYKAARSGFEGASHTKNDLFTLRSIQVSDNMKMFVGVLEHAK